MTARSLLLLAGCAAFAARALPAAEWRVLCDRAAGTVEAVEGAAGEGRVALAGPFAGPSTARAWIEERCPSQRCSPAGECLAGAAPDPAARPADSQAPAEADDWAAGEVVDLGARARPAAPLAGPAAGGPLPASAADLSSMVSTATAAASACRFDAAKRSAEQMARFDPAHPWLAANQEKLRSLADRQSSTERNIWQAASELERHDFKAARRSARAAADTALGCQSQAVSQLVFGIESADERLRQERHAANQRLAAALVVPLLQLANTLAGAGAPAPSTPAWTAGVAGAAGAAPATGDRCVYQYDYPNEWTFIPVCSCPGWTFAPAQFRCVRTSG